MRRLPAMLIRRAWDRLKTDGPANQYIEGYGIALMSNYLWYTDPGSDSGLRYTFASGGAARDAYDAWPSLTT